jgi:hypothetical protein
MRTNPQPTWSVCHVAASRNKWSADINKGDAEVAKEGELEAEALT